MVKFVMILAWLRVPQPPAKISPNKLLYSIDCVGLTTSAGSVTNPTLPILRSSGAKKLLSYIELTLKYLKKYHLRSRGIFILACPV
jgi:hypothetical protein